MKADGQGGTGVIAAVNLVTGRNVVQIWPSRSGKQSIAGTDQVGYATDVDNIQVAAGELIRFEVHANGDNSHDTVSWTPSIGYVGGSL